MQNNLLPKKRNSYKTKNSNWDEWRRDFVGIPSIIHTYVCIMRPDWQKRMIPETRALYTHSFYSRRARQKRGWQEGTTPKTRAYYGLEYFLGRTPTESELKQVTRTPLMTHSVVHFALAIFAMEKGIPFESLEHYYYNNKAWQRVREKLRIALKLGKHERYSTKDVYHRYSYSVLSAKFWWWRPGVDKIYVLKDITEY